MKLRPYLQHLAIGRITANRLSPQFARTLLRPLHQEQPRCAGAVLWTREWTQPLSEAYGLGTSLGIPSSALMLALPMPRLLWRHLVCPVHFRGVFKFQNCYPDCVRLHIKFKKYVKTCHFLSSSADHSRFSPQTGPTISSLWWQYLL